MDSRIFYCPYGINLIVRRHGNTANQSTLLVEVVWVTYLPKCVLPKTVVDRPAAAS